MTTLKRYLLVIVAALSLVIMPSAANAQYVPLSCTNGAATGQFYYADPVNNQGACEFQGVQHIFSQIVCSFVVILNNVLGSAYCGIQFALTPVLAIAMSLYIILFGGQVLMGTAQLNSKEVVVRLLKIAGVWTFATQSTWGINIVFQFLIGAATQGSTWVVNSINQGNAAIMPVQMNNGDFMLLFSYLDTLIYNAITGPFTQANDKVIGFFIVLMFFFPALFAMACNWVIKTALMLARTLMDFMLCLSAITFLISLMSAFLGFLLFPSTAYLFEEWLKYIISYTLRILITFAIISLWIATMNLFGGFFNELSNLIWPYQHMDVSNVFSPNDTYGVCQYLSGYGPPGAICPVAGNPTAPCPAGVNSCAAYPTSPCFPSLQCDPANPPNNNNVVSVSQLLFKPAFIFFMTYNLTALLIIAHAFGILMEKAPEISTQLSGPAQVPSLGGGFGMKGFGQIGNFGGGAAKSKSLAPPAGSGAPTSDFLGNAAKMLLGRDTPSPLGGGAGGAPGGPKPVSLGADNMPAINPAPGAGAPRAQANRPGDGRGARAEVAYDADGNAAGGNAGDSPRTVKLALNSPAAGAQSDQPVPWPDIPAGAGAAAMWNFDAEGNMHSMPNASADPIPVAFNPPSPKKTGKSDDVAGLLDRLLEKSAFPPLPEAGASDASPEPNSPRLDQNASAARTNNDALGNADTAKANLTGNSIFKKADAGFSAADASTGRLTPDQLARHLERAGLSKGEVLKIARMLSGASSMSDAITQLEGMAGDGGLEGLDMNHIVGRLREGDATAQAAKTASAAPPAAQPDAGQGWWEERSTQEPAGETRLAYSGPDTSAVPGVSAPEKKGDKAPASGNAPTTDPKNDVT